VAAESTTKSTGTAKNWKFPFLELNLLIFCSYSMPLARYEVKKHDCVMYLFWRCSIYDIEAPWAARHRKWLCHMSCDIVWLAERGRARTLSFNWKPIPPSWMNWRKPNHFMLKPYIQLLDCITFHVTCLSDTWTTFYITLSHVSKITSILHLWGKFYICSFALCWLSFLSSWRFIGSHDHILIRTILFADQGMEDTNLATRVVVLEEKASIS
jgi:hypothetical protein